MAKDLSYSSNWEKEQVLNFTMLVNGYLLN